MGENIVAVGRNDPCPCGSGKKYKRCCFGQKTVALSQAEIESQALAQAELIAVQGKSSEAITLLEQMLATNLQQHATAQRLGIVALRQGCSFLAINLFQKALQNTTVDSACLTNMSAAYIAQEKWEDALNYARLALSVGSSDIHAYNNQGVALLNLGQYQEALESFQHAVELQPQFFEAICGMGEAHESLGNLQEALKDFNCAVSLKADDWKVYIRLSHLLTKIGSYDLAVRCCRLVLEHAPDFVEAYNSLTSIALEQKRFTEAEGFARQALTLRPYLAESHFNLGFVLHQLGHLVEAEECYRQSLVLRPNVRAMNNLAMLLKQTSRLSEAISYYRAAIELGSDSHLFSNMLLTMQYSMQVSDEELFQEHLRFAEKFEQPHLLKRIPNNNILDPHRKLHIGYVSADFREHAAYLFISPVLENHDKANYKIFCYYNNKIFDENTEHIHECADVFVRCDSMSDSRLAERIRSDKIDILVDLSGHTTMNRLTMFAFKPAPIQVTWIGYAGTTGLASMDYRLTDRHLDPHELSDKYHTEKLVHLPSSALFRWNEQEYPPVNSLPALSDAPFTFGCLNLPSKLNADVLQTWSKILDRVPQARLMVGGIDGEKSRIQVLQMLDQAGVAEDRVMLRHRCSLKDYYTLHHQIDLALDPFPYNGGTTTCHALMMGIPVLTLAGTRAVSRCGSSLMKNFGLDEFVVDNPIAYIERAVEMTQALDRLNQLRLSMRDRLVNTPLADPEQYTRNLEDAYRKMWCTWVSQRLAKEVE